MNRGLRILFLVAVVSVLAHQCHAADYAVLVGVKTYGSSTGLKPLKYSENDVEELSKVLVDSGYQRRNVVVLTQKRGADNPDLLPTAKNIRKQLDLRLDGLSASDSVLIAFAGHGVKFKDAAPSYFCPLDCDLSERTNLLSYASLYEQLKSCRAGQKLLLSDACRNDPISGTARSAASLTRPEPQLPPGSTVALFACKAGQEAQEDDKLTHGVFFHYVLEGLRGKADKPGLDSKGNNNKTVELTELVAWTQRNVRDHVRAAPFFAKQEPELKIHNDNIDQLFNYSVLRLSEIPKVITSSIGLQLRLIPAGEFLMGSPASEEKRDSGGEHQHRVKISQSFYMGTYEVTQEEYRAVMGISPGYFSSTGGGKEKVTGQITARFPVESVSWYDAVDFCNRLSAKDSLSACYRLSAVEREDGSIKSADVQFLSGTGYRLPTEAEWEYACRAGTSTPFHFGSILNGAQANHNGNFPYGTSTKGADLGRPARAGSYSPNAWGLYDMHGNVWEWCSDWYDSDYYKSSPAADPRGPSTGSGRVVRGGSCSFHAWSCRSANRGRSTPDVRSYDLGFRVLRSSIR